jgi:hypothetical protein
MDIRLQILDGPYCQQFIVNHLTGPQNVLRRNGISTFTTPITGPNVVACVWVVSSSISRRQPFRHVFRLVCSPILEPRLTFTSIEPNARTLSNCNFAQHHVLRNCFPIGLQNNVRIPLPSMLAGWGGRAMRQKSWQWEERMTGFGVRFWFTHVWLYVKTLAFPADQLESGGDIPLYDVSGSAILRSFLLPFFRSCFVSRYPCLVLARCPFTLLMIFYMFAGCTIYPFVLCSNAVMPVLSHRLFPRYEILISFTASLRAAVSIFNIPSWCNGNSAQYLVVTLCVASPGFES